MDFLGGGWKGMLGTQQEFEEVNNQEIEELNDEEADKLQDYYFGNLAPNNHDEKGCDYWMSSLTPEEGREIIRREEKKLK